MDEPLRATVAVVLLVSGLALCGYAGYLQYVALPEERTFGQRSKRAVLALGGLALALLGSWLLS
jgi:cytochrome c-type biogenesis protein CcmE